MRARKRALPVRAQKVKDLGGRGLFVIKPGLSTYNMSSRGPLGKFATSTGSYKLMRSLQALHEKRV